MNILIFIWQDSALIVSEFMLFSGFLFLWFITGGTTCLQSSQFFRVENMDCCICRTSSCSCQFDCGTFFEYRFLSHIVNWCRGQNSLVLKRSIYCLYSITETHPDLVLSLETGQKQLKPCNLWRSGIIPLFQKEN